MARVPTTQTIEIRVLGQKTVLRAADGDPERVKAVAEMVSRLIRSAEKRAPKGTIAPHQVLLLALMDLGEEYLSSRDRVGALLEEVGRKTTRLVEIVEERKAGSK